MTNKTKQTIIEISADYIYLVIIGEKETLKDFSKKIKNYSNDKSKEYIVTRLDIPILFRYDKIKKYHNNIEIIDVGTESAQSYAFAQEQFIFPKQNKKFKENDSSINYMLMEIDDNILRFPKIDLVDEDPEKIIYEWVKKNYGSIPDKIKKTIKPLSLVGYDNDILVYTACI
jgi:hypothetical protein